MKAQDGILSVGQITYTHMHMHIHTHTCTHLEAVLFARLQGISVDVSPGEAWPHVS